MCAYCMKSIQDDPLETTIEHWFPLDKDKDKVLDYKNMLAVCRGGATLDLEKGHKRELCCDASKGNSEIKEKPMWDEFAGVTIFFLERKIRLLQKLGK